MSTLNGKSSEALQQRLSIGGKKYSFVLDDLLNGQQWRECNKIWGGLLFVKGKNNPILNEWLDLTLVHPDIIIDPDQNEMKDQYPYFALHKHDQVLLVALAYKYKQICLVLPELCETCGENVAVFASRIRTRNLKEYIVLRIKYWGRKILGDNLFESIKRLFIKK